MLLLIEWQKRQQALRLRDKFEVQSCLKTFELSSDKGASLKDALAALDHASSMSLTWLNHPSYGEGTKTVSVSKARFHVD